MSARPTRLAAGLVALVLPFAAVAGCGAEKKRTVKAEFAAAQGHLENSKAASFTLRLADGRDSLRTLLKKEDTASVLADALVGGSITYVIDPAGAKTLKDVSATPSTSAADLTAQLKDVNLAVVIRDDKATLGELRLVEGALYVHVDLTEIGRLATAGGAEDFDAQLDAFTTEGPPQLAALVADMRAGKWITLDLAKYMDKLTELAGSFGEGFGASPAPQASPFDAEGLGRRLFDGVKPYVTVTDANDSSSDRVLDVKVEARPAIKAALKILAATDDLPFPNVFTDVDPAEIDKNIKPGTANGQIRLADGHLTSVTVDVESIRTLAVDPGTDSLAGTGVVLEVDDSAEAVTAPKDVSTVDLGALFEEFFDGLAQGFSESSSSGTALAG